PGEVPAQERRAPVRDLRGVRRRDRGAGPAHPRGQRRAFATLPGNLPASTTLLLGRDEDLTALTELVSQHPVVTITGPGGVGKTSAMTELGRRLAPEFQGRLAFVPLAEVDTPDGFVPAIA